MVFPRWYTVDAMLIACAVIVADVQLDAALVRNHFGERRGAHILPDGAICESS